LRKKSKKSDFIFLGLQTLCRISKEKR